MIDEEKIRLLIAQHEASGKYAEVNGVRTFYLDEGIGPVVFCIHGVPTSSYLYRKVVHELRQRGMRAVAIDLPGLGLSDRPENFDYRFPSFASFCKHFIDQSGIDAFHLVLHDIGTPIGLALAAETGNRVRSITVLNSMLDIAHFSKPMPMKPFSVPIIGEAELAMVTHLTWPAMLKYGAVVDYESLPEEELLAYVDLLKREDGGSAFLKIMRQFERSESFNKTCYDAFCNPQYPVQIIWGEKDPMLTYEEYGKQFETARKNVKVYKVEARHFVQEEQYAFIAERVKDIARV